jgi:hypothetical protein
MLTSATATAQDGAGEALGRPQATILVANDLVGARRFLGLGQADVAPHTPRDPKQQQATGKDQADNSQ